MLFVRLIEHHIYYTMFGGISRVSVYPENNLFTWSIVAWKSTMYILHNFISPCERSFSKLMVCGFYIVCNTDVLMSMCVICVYS